LNNLKILVFRFFLDLLALAFFSIYILSFIINFYTWRTQPIARARIYIYIKNYIQARLRIKYVRRETPKNEKVGYCLGRKRSQNIPRYKLWQLPRFFALKSLGILPPSNFHKQLLQTTVLLTKIQGKDLQFTAIGHPMELGFPPISTLSQTKLLT
jgi:hypothetical protein